MIHFPVKLTRFTVGVAVVCSGWNDSLLIKLVMRSHNIYIFAYFSTQSHKHYSIFETTAGSINKQKLKIFIQKMEKSKEV